MSKTKSKPKTATQQETGGDCPSASCCAIVDAFREALKNGKLQQCIHDDWVDVDTEKIPVGYVARANHWRIIPHNVDVEAQSPEIKS